MKKHPYALLTVLTALFAAFTLGFYLGRNLNHETVQLSTVSTEARHDETIATAAPEETVVPQVTFPININTASAYELAELPGIGETIAGRIVEYRTLNGDFSSPEELLNVEGIGSGKLEGLLDYVTTGG